MKQEDTKQKILEKALELFSTYGYDSVSVGEIAKAVGIKAPSLYNHFPSKQAIFDAIVEATAAQYEKDTDAIDIHVQNAAQDISVFTAISEDAGLSQAEYISKSVQTDCLMEVAAGTADAAVLDLTLATAMIGEGTDYANLAIKDELNAEEYGVAFRKGSDTAEAVNAAFDELKADGTMQALADKYSLTLAD